ncbi:uncharacterized protein M421DRAFT_3377 [Didymella exigua CBS 183.55]|uniref:Uncharacterized protein n=1 Tax=Didymella exigua CBS 183.55 TaxID=1150837 RepID=A0A6A5RSG3_9PLEO|nr:uncharacterized protein M421DRAFT_3377 [Didymella exigua CBS 183.55]KAF1930300.1 hypothetical protein M421DRAFT_3377 [Didymella exigua CBS 183.55]
MFAHRHPTDGQHTDTTSAQNAPVRQLIHRLETRLGDLASQQEEVAESREQVLVRRGQLVQSGKRVQQQRDRTANAEVLFMNLLRHHYNGLGSTFPTEIDAAYARVDEERTELGSLEVEYSELNRTLGAQEWTHMDLENSLYQYDVQQILADELVDNIETTRHSSDREDVSAAGPFPPSAAVQYQVETTEYARLRKWFRVLRIAIARLFESSTLSIDDADLGDIKNTEAVRSFDHVLTQLTECEVRLQHLKADRMVADDDAQPLRGRRGSEPVMYERSQSFASDIISKAHTEGAVPRRTDRVPVMHRIRDWLLDGFKQNCLDRMQYVSILQKQLDAGDDEDVDLSEWEVLVIQQWPFDMTTTEPATHAAEIVPSSSSSPQTFLRVDSNHGGFLFDQEHIALSQTLQLQSLETQQAKDLLEDLLMDVPADDLDFTSPSNSTFVLRSINPDSVAFSLLEKMVT